MSACYEGELDWELSQTEWDKFQETLKELEQRVEQIQGLQKLNEISERKEEQFSHQNLVLSVEVKEVKEEPKLEMQPPPYQKPPPYVPPLPFPLRGVTKHTSSSGVKNSAKQKVVQQDFSNPLDEELCLEGLFAEGEPCSRFHETLSPEREIIDSEDTTLFTNEEESIISLDESHVGRGKGEFTWGVQIEYIDFDQCQTKKDPEMLEEWSKKDFPLCWMIQKYASWRHDRLIDGTFLWYQDGYSK
ncbi:OLC1v1024577C1 [Oldenlandia corymbosa var. corymbosa]|uniref:OLC1v1024577C1 n=1 Tax=Oldenlandia corymbosa var. corymbosa TaxID=529605 RepID=A0AAV1C2T8_OLDCO|nr:OLC1v1024577C1 [Oldenlandia corymbosa var. corymbosa]